MSLAETAELVAEMNLKGNFPQMATRFQKGLDGLNARTKTLQQGLGKIGKGLAKGFKTGVVAGGAAVGFLAYNVVQGIESLAELEDVTNATNRVIASTRGVAKVTAAQVRSLAQEYEDLTTVDDKTIQSAENLLLTFTNVRKRAFEPTLRTALDMAAALDMDVTAAVKSLGKALNDPAAGLSRLTRLGVTFTEQEKEKIATLQKSGRTFEAQQIILGKLNRLYGGQAKAAASGYRGSINRLKDSVEELQQSLAAPLIRPLTKVANKLSAFAKTRDIQDGIKGIGTAFASLFEDTFQTVTDTEGGQSATVVKRIASPFSTGLAMVKDAFNTVKTLPWDQIRGGLDQTFQVAAKAVDLFKGLPPELQTALVTLLAANKLTGGLVASGLKDIAGLALKSLTTITAANVTVVGKTVTGPGGASPTPPGAPTKGKGGGLTGLLSGGLAGILGAIALGGFGSQQDALTTQEYAQRADLSNERLGQMLEFDRWMLEKQDGGNTVQRTGNFLLGGIKGFISRANEYAALQARLAPVQNDILDGIAADAQKTAQRTGQINPLLSRINNVGQRTAGNTAGIVAAVNRTTAATNAGTAATRRQDLSVRVSVAATTVVQGVTRVTNQNRFVID